MIKKPEIKNLEKAARRILKAIKSNERIIICGDSDLDGVTSVIILKEVITSLGREPKEIYFPDRESEGYGLTLDSLKYFKKHAPALIITLDFGIGNFKEVEAANKLDFEVIIIDHHEVLDKLPDASIIVDPKQKGDNYPFKQFANAGLTFKLAEAILKEKLTETLRKNFLELAAMATIADMMPKIEENEEMINEGLSYLESSWRPGIQTLFKLEESDSLKLLDRVYKVNSLLNIRDVKDRMPASFRLLTASDEKEAHKLAKLLVLKGKEKKERVKEIVDAVERRVFGRDSDIIIFEGKEDWELELLGVAASILVQRHRKPVFLYKKGKKDIRAGSRAPSEYNLVEAMKNCSTHLMTYGGHPQAAGFRILNKHLEEFRECLVKYFEK
ncbi:MAG: DHH family phosphoesterase [Candidatus Pacebacteria bacterium]|nr:DHH family phosphoesterase [Candidatus Paceibacterota bacterium]